MRRSSSSLARAFRRSDINVVRPRMVDMLSVEKRLAGPLPPPALRIVVARFSVGDVVGPRRRVERRIVSPLWLP